MKRKQNYLIKFIYWARNIRSRQLFNILPLYCKGKVLDVGGGDFYFQIKNQIKIDQWITLEPSRSLKPKQKSKKFDFVVGDGCDMKFSDSSFDTVLCIQVLEHVFEPIKMFSEIHRVLKSGGYLILLVPQTGVLHMSPHHFQNFTRYWIIRAAKNYNLKLIEMSPMGGFWSSIASRLLYFYFQSLGVKTFTNKKHSRNLLFYLFLPFMWIFAFISIFISLVFSLGDLCEEPNNHLVVLKK